MFGITNYASFALAVLVFLAIPGPGLLGILAATARGGRSTGLRATLGVMSGDMVLMACAGLGVAALLQANPIVFKVIQYCGAAYLVYLGIGLWRAPASAQQPAAALAQPFRRLFLITLMNPKAIVFYMAFFPLFIDRSAHHGGWTLLVMALSVSTLTLLFCGACVLATHQLARQLRGKKWLAALLRRAAGVFLIGFGVKLGTAQ